MELALDTSTEFASVALAQEGRLLAEVTWRAGQRHSAQLLAQVERLLEAQGATSRDLKLVVVALGPGSFNGLRTGVGTAKGLCLALGLPLVGVTTLEVGAYPFAATGRPLCPLHEAGRGDVAVALYRQLRGRWRCLAPPQLLPFAELVDWAPPRALFCGEMPLRLSEALIQARGAANVVAGARALRRAGYLAELGWQRWQGGHREEIERLEPLYLRRPSITGPALSSAEGPAATL